MHLCESQWSPDDSAFKSGECNSLSSYIKEDKERKRQGDGL